MRSESEHSVRGGKGRLCVGVGARPPKNAGDDDDDDDDDDDGDMTMTAVYFTVAS
jgi:hypothetical protein